MMPPMTNTTMTVRDEPWYIYDERVLLQAGDDEEVVEEDVTSDNSAVRVESYMAWNRQATIHPFGKLQQALMASPVHEGSSSTTTGSSIQRVTFSVASCSSQSFRFMVPKDDEDYSSSDLSNIPFLNQENNNVLPHFPSGFWLEILASQLLSLSELNSLLDHWKNARIITTPTEGSVWDREEVRLRMSPPTRTAAAAAPAAVDPPPHASFRHQLFLPTTGAAWSADAWHQTMQALLPTACATSHRNNFFDVAAMEWSRLLVEGSLATEKQFWIQWSRSSSSHMDEVNMGLQFRVRPDTHYNYNNNNNKNGGLPRIISRLPPTLFSETASCPLATRSIQRVTSQDAATAKVIATLEQVVRGQAMSPNHGRLETWFTASSPPSWAAPPSLSSSSSNSVLLQDCQLQIRQKLPSFVAPQWQSIQILSSNGGGGLNDTDDITTSVEWEDDHGDRSAILRISTNTTSHNQVLPSFLMFSLDYEPVFLSLDDFPGDPNRGRELPPAVATIQCQQQGPQESTSASIITAPVTIPLYSNVVLVIPPVPDMSMPFNVLSLTCSLYAYLIGTIITLLVKRSSERIKYRLHPNLKPISKFKVLKDKIRCKFQQKTTKLMMTTRTMTNTTTSEEENHQGNL